MECRSENVTQGPPLTALRFILSPTGPVSRGMLAPSTLAVLARPSEWASTNAAISCGVLHTFSVAAHLSSWTPPSSHLPSFPLSASQGPCLTLRCSWISPASFPSSQPDASSRFLPARQNLCRVLFSPCQ